MARREWASGSVYKHGNRWRVSVSLGSDAFGKRVRKEWQLRTEKAAYKKLDKVQSRLRDGLAPEESRVTLAAYTPEWLAHVEGNVRPSTFSFYRTLATAHLDELGHLPLVRIGPAEVRGLIAKRRSEGYSSRTIRGVLDVLRMILRQAMGDGILTRNVVELVDRPKLETKEPVHFSAAQARRFLDAARDDPLYSLYAVALGTGLRRGELLGLTWRDIDRDGEHGGGAYVNVRRGKTASATRRVPLPAFASEALEMVPRSPGPIWNASPTYVTRKTAEICERAGLPRLTTHGLRHTAASLMLDAGVPIEVIRTILGHTTVRMSEHYARPGDDLRRDAVERLGRMVG